MIKGGGKLNGFL